MPDKPLANTWGQIDREALRERINAALRTVEQPRRVRHFRVERADPDIRVLCWCGKARRLGLLHINVFCQRFEDFLDEHAECEPKGDA